MMIRIGVGVTREWEEDALPLLMRAGLRVVGRATAPEAEGEWMACDLECTDPITSDTLFAVLDRVRAIVAESMVPHISIVFVAS